MDRIIIPKKQLALYKGTPFINQELLLNKLADSTYDLGRAKDVVLSQLNDAQFQGIIIR